MRPRENTVAAKNPVITGVRRKNPYSGMLAAKKATMAIQIQTVCLSKKEFSTENERMVTNPRREIASALAKMNQSICVNAPACVGRRMLSPATRLKADIPCYLCSVVTSKGGTRGVMSILPDWMANGSGQVNTICEDSSAPRRWRDVADAANALPAGSKMTAMNEMFLMSTTALFCAIAVRRGISEVLVRSLLLTEIGPAAFFMRSHTRGSINSKYVCATMRFPVSIRA